VSSANEQWRLFLALPTTDEVQACVSDAQLALRAHRLPVRWVDEELTHITVKFLGDTPRDRVDALKEQLAAAVAGHNASRLATAELGAFPNPRKPYVLWLGVGGELAAVQALAGSIDDVAAQFDVERSHRPFRPHVTIGRWRYQDGQAFDITELLRETAIPSAPLPVERVQLIRSILRARGPEYTVIAEWPLT